MISVHGDNVCHHSVWWFDCARDVRQCVVVRVTSVTECGVLVSSVRSSPGDVSLCVGSGPGDISPGDVSLCVGSGPGDISLCVRSVSYVSVCGGFRRHVHMMTVTTCVAGPRRGEGKTWTAWCSRCQGEWGHGVSRQT